MNNETKHTAGNWDVSTHADNNDIVVRSTKGIIANLSTDKWEEMSQEQAEANARLIAAAPELLETLQRTFKRLEAFRNECLQEDSQEREIIIDIETDILDKIRKATRVS